MITDENLQNILQKLTESLENIYGTKLKTIILYGSAAKGNATPDSDIDIMVLVDGNAQDLRKYEDKLSHMSTDFALEYLKVFSMETDITIIQKCR